MSEKGGSIWGKIKKGYNDTATKAGIETTYLRAKSKGFVHTEEVEPHINVLRRNREEIPKLYEHVVKTGSHVKKLATDDKDLGESLSLFGENETENLGLQSFMFMYSEFLAQLSSLRFTLDAMYDQVKTDFHMIAKDDLKEIRKVHDTTNHHLTDAHYWFKKGDKAHLTASQSKYGEFAAQLITLIQAHRENKEANLPGYLKSLMKSQMQFFEAAAQLSQKYHVKMDQLPPVQVRPYGGIPSGFNPRPGPGIAAGHTEDSGASAPAAHQPAAHQPAPAQARAPVPTPAPRTAPPPSFAKKAKAMYDFNAENPQELSFKVGDVLVIHESNGEWWVGEVRGKRGFIPASYVQLIS